MLTRAAPGWIERNTGSRGLRGGVYVGWENDGTNFVDLAAYLRCNLNLIIFT